MSTTRWVDNPVLSLVCRVLAAAVFLYAGIVKAGNPVGFSTQVAKYEFLPEFANLIGVFFPWMEIVLALFLFAGVWPRAAALGMLGMTTLFIIAMGQALARGLKIDCGCFGGSEPLTIWTLLRDGAIFLPALQVTLSRAHRWAIAPD